MNREQLEHVIRAAGSVIGDEGVIIIGSQAILGTFPDGLPELATLSTEVDVLAFDDPSGEKADAVAGALGEFSQFHETFDVYADGVDVTTAKLPDGWQDRLMEVNTVGTGGRTGWCLGVADLCASKLAAHRDKDLAYVEAVVGSGHVSRTDLVERIMGLPVDAVEKKRSLDFLQRTAPPGRKSSAYRSALRSAREQLDSSG